MSGKEIDLLEGRVPDMPSETGGALSRAASRMDVSGMSLQEVERLIRRMIESGSDGNIYSAMALARQTGARPPQHRDFVGPPSAFGGPVGPTGRPRPLMREQDQVGFAGGPDDFGRLPDSGLFEAYPEYEAAYLNAYSKPMRRR